MLVRGSDNEISEAQTRASRLKSGDLARVAHDPGLEQRVPAEHLALLDVRGAIGGDALVRLDSDGLGAHERVGVLVDDELLLVPPVDHHVQADAGPPGDVGPAVEMHARSCWRTRYLRRRASAGSTHPRSGLGAAWRSHRRSQHCAAWRTNASAGLCPPRVPSPD